MWMILLVTESKWRKEERKKRDGANNKITRADTVKRGENKGIEWETRAKKHTAQ